MDGHSHDIQGGGREWLRCPYMLRQVRAPAARAVQIQFYYFVYGADFSALNKSRYQFQSDQSIIMILIIPAFNIYLLCGMLENC